MIRARYFDERGGLRAADIVIRDGAIASASPYSGDADELPYLMPGLCDIHTHGNSGCDFSDGDYDGLVTMARYLRRNGVLRFSPALMTLPEEQLTRACGTARRFYEEAPDGCAKLVGITMEGPFFSPNKKGAQAGEYLRLPDYGLYSRLQRASGGLIKIACVAPELEGGAEFIRAVALEGITVSLAHTECDYQGACEAFDAGASHLTHMFNAMPSILHRAPGPIPAASEREDVTAELICDGIHVHASVVRMAHRLFGTRLCLISDAISACGMEDGVYSLGGQSVTVKGGRATLADGTIAGSTSNLWTCMRNAVAFGIPLADAVASASSTPARVVGAQGAAAGLVLCSPSLEIVDICT